ncbi:hypothetical protein [Chitinophaga sp. LS1]|uniref:hypothetical protein n=1 Tax=Chitinophaga sp. LS1 TaxID=3051176 RepID=UPI002AAA6563|nr:hypothetical protein [Chitinophaga sp. LS1]WPV70478.1 hypothetical protein QQL36_17355 [Chitinophaga sp. LS1]
MKFKLYFLFLLLPCIVTDVCAQYVDLTFTVKNTSSDGDGSTAVIGQTLTYTITMKNLSTTTSITGVRLIADIPYGTNYKPGTTKQGAAVLADVIGN